MNANEWIHDPSLQNISPKKLLFLQALFQAQKNLTQKEMLPFLIALNKKQTESNISFEPSELQCILEVLKKHASPQELNMITLLTSYVK